MSIWQRLMYLIGLRPTPGPRTYEISESLQITVSTLAQHEGMDGPHDFAVHLKTNDPANPDLIVNVLSDWIPE